MWLIIINPFLYIGDKWIFWSNVRTCSVPTYETIVVCGASIRVLSQLWWWQSDYNGCCAATFQNFHSEEGWNWQGEWDDFIRVLGGEIRCSYICIRTLAPYAQQSLRCIREPSHRLLLVSRQRLLDQLYPTASAIVSDCSVPFSDCSVPFFRLLWQSFPFALNFSDCSCSPFRLLSNFFRLLSNFFPIAQYLLFIAQ